MGSRRFLTLEKKWLKQQPCVCRDTYRGCVAPSELGASREMSGEKVQNESKEEVPWGHNPALEPLAAGCCWCWVSKGEQDKFTVNKPMGSC